MIVVFNLFWRKPQMNSHHRGKGQLDCPLIVGRCASVSLIGRIVSTCADCLSD